MLIYNGNKHHLLFHSSSYQNYIWGKWLTRNSEVCGSILKLHRWTWTTWILEMVVDFRKDSAPQSISSVIRRLSRGCTSCCSWISSVSEDAGELLHFYHLIHPNMWFAASDFPCSPHVSISLTTKSTCFRSLPLQRLRINSPSDNYKMPKWICLSKKSNNWLLPTTLTQVMIGSKALEMCLHVRSTFILLSCFHLEACVVPQNGAPATWEMFVLRVCEGVRVCWEGDGGKRQE